jgi:hypothetical protein
MIPFLLSFLEPVVVEVVQLLMLMGPSISFLLSLLLTTITKLMKMMGFNRRNSHALNPGTGQNVIATNMGNNSNNDQALENDD